MSLIAQYSKCLRWVVHRNPKPGCRTTYELELSCGHTVIRYEYGEETNQAHCVECWSKGLRTGDGV